MTCVCCWWHITVSVWVWISGSASVHTHVSGRGPCPCAFFRRSLKANAPPPHHLPPRPLLLLPLALCLVWSTIVYSVPSRASGDTPRAKATVRGEIVGRGPRERDTGSFLVWERGPRLQEGRGGPFGNTSAHLMWWFPNQGKFWSCKDSMERFGTS